MWSSGAWLSIAWSSGAWAGPSSLMPVAGSEIASEVDSLYKFLLVISAISCFLLIGGMIYFAYKFRRKTNNDKTAYITHNHFLEFLWSFIPFVIFMVVFAWGWWVYDKMRTFPEDAFEVHVVAKQWSFEFVYKSGKTSPELVVPEGRPIKLVMTSMDVLHSFFIPSMRVKQDIIPGRYAGIWLQPQLQGEFRIFCTVYGGRGHSAMITKMQVVTPQEFEVWLANDPFKGLSLAEIGQKLYTMKGCVACHNLDATKKVGPGFAGLWGQQRKFTDGSSVAVNEDYIRESILNPNAKVVEGFTPAMPTFMGQIKDKEITAIIEFFKTLK